MKKPDFISAKNAKFFAAFIVIFFLGVYASDSNIISLDKYINRPASDNKNLPDKLNYKSVEEVYDKLKENYDGKLTQSKLEDGLRKGLVEAAGDPYTEFMNAKESQEFKNELDGSFEGIGAELGKDGNNIVIVSPIEGYPAAKAGLKPKDIIIEINGKSAADISVSEAVKQIRGPKGSSVELKVSRNGELKEFNITRDKISIPSVESKVVSGNIGLIKISRFGDDTVSLTQQKARELKNKGVKGVILDLRGNPGGLLNAAVGVSSVWLDQGQTVLKEKRSGKIIDTYYASGSPILNGVKTVVLIDGGSASASEITAGALRDNNAATLIGEQSYGKGSVQQVIDLHFGGLLKVTIARWYTPDDVNIDKDGITPDKKVKFTESDVKNSRDPQQQTAVNLLK